MNPDQNQPPVHNPLAVMQSDERVLCEIKRHPIGIIGVYVGGGFFVLLFAVLAFVVAPQFLTGANRNQLLAIALAAFAFVSLVVLAFVLMSAKIYHGNRWIVTTDSITQISQTGLFSKQSSQLSMGNLEDVTAEQNGVLTHMFNYGLLRAETAGERSKFMFYYCPNPNYYAQQILGAREAFEQGRQGGDEQRLYREQGAYSQPPSPPPQPPTDPTQERPPQA